MRKQLASDYRKSPINPIIIIHDILLPSMIMQHPLTSPKMHPLERYSAFVTRANSKKVAQLKLELARV
jgi:hypothetical protein